MSTTTSITVRVPLRTRRRPGQKTVVTPVRAAGADTVIFSRADPALVKAVARAFRYQRLLDEGQYASVSELAAAERIERGYLGRLLRLTLLAPEIVQGILDGRAAVDLTLPRLLEPLATSWSEQQAVLTSPASMTGAASVAV